MKPAEYATLHNYETWYWWYRAQRAAVRDAVASLRLPAGARVLDAGCGTGRTIRMLEGETGKPLRVFGFDLSPLAAQYWNGRAGHCCLGSANAAPFASESFDAAVSVDVLYVRQVTPENALREMARMLKPGGAAVLIVPAYEWLRSSHDAAVHGVRRFTRPGLTALLKKAGLSIQRITHCSTFLFPAIAAARLMRRSGAGSTNGSDLRPLPRWMNAGLTAVALAETRLLRRVNLPFGSSILAIACKPHISEKHKA